MVVERPSLRVVPPFGLRFADVVQQCRPAQPQVVALAAYVVKHFKRVVEVVFVRPAISLFNDVEGGKLRQQPRQQSAAVQVDKTLARRGGHHYLVKLFLYALSADYLYAVGVARQCVKRLVFNEEVKLCGKADAPQHAQRVVGEGYVGV